MCTTAHSRTINTFEDLCWHNAFLPSHQTYMCKNSYLCSGIIFPIRVFCALRGRSIKPEMVYSFWRLVLTSSPLIEKCKNSQISLSVSAPTFLCSQSFFIPSHSLSVSLSTCLIPPPTPMLKQSSITLIPLCYPSLNLPPSFPGPSSRVVPPGWLGATQPRPCQSPCSWRAERRLTAPWANQ